MSNHIDRLLQYIESTDMHCMPITVAETNLYLSAWSKIFIEPFIGAPKKSTSGWLDLFESEKISHFFDEYALAEYRKQPDCVSFIHVTDGSSSIACGAKSPEDLQRFCKENGRFNNSALCQVIVHVDDFRWTLAVNVHNYFFAYSPIEINQEVRKDLFG